MSDDIKSLAEERRRQEISSRIAQNVGQTSDGSRIFVSPDGSTFDTSQRTVGDKIDYGMLIQKQIDNCFFCGIYSYDAFARSVIIFLNAIPEIEEDEQFRDEVRKATIKVRYGTGRWRGFGGQTREIMDEYDDFDHFKIFRAIINCLRRRGLYSVPKLWNESQHELYWTHSVIDRIKNGSPSGADSALAKEEPVKFPELPNEAQKKDEKEVNGA